MRFYSTEYILKTEGKSEKFAGTICARNAEEACRYAVIRNIGERITGVITDKNYNPCPLPSDLYKTRDLIECIHCLVFYGWIAAKVMIEDCDTLLNDHGVIHEVLHELHHGSFYGFREEIYQRLVSLESRIPGLKSYHDLQIGEEISV